ncbi:hypothetical protein Pyn_09975 [Prunus yedoensis var. nudiflora]|uniref:Uncharacterized protein n=1 Tax=Prunus yedoensis var. nudiflora TaxID=2094558 RepID=A0A314YWH6_PRUYE|nr:hypothetical protein Pyn_09975 [Prunus yedoensis var. nudiflora]
MPAVGSLGAFCVGNNDTITSSEGKYSPCRDPVEPPPSMIELSLYSIVLDYEDQEYFNYMMSE